MTLKQALQETRDLGINLFQICDYAPLEKMTLKELDEIALFARNLEVDIELGVRGIEPDRLLRQLKVARTFQAKMVRTMLINSDSRPGLPEAISKLAHIMPQFEESGVVLALETYEQVATDELLQIVEAVNSPNLGICLDPANVVARLENPKECVESVADWVKSIHVKDFAFARQEGLVGFTLSGSELGKGLHDYPHLLESVKPRSRGVNEIVEHWVPWQGTIEETIEKEKSWTKSSIEYLRRVK